MFSIRAQYFLAFAVMGGLLPFLSIYLKKARGLSESQVGIVAAVASVAIVFTPVLVTLLADTRVAARRLMAAAYVVAAAALAGLLAAGGFWALMLLYSAFAFAFAPVVPLQDGINFAEQERRARSGRRRVPFHRVRVWGTVGFLLPSVILFVLLQAGWSVTAAIVTAFAFCALGLVNAMWLPDTLPPASPPAPLDSGPDAPAELPAESAPPSGDHVDGAVTSGAAAPSPLPTLAAASVMLRPGVRGFCIAMWLMHLAIAGFYTFYPLYLSDQIGIDDKWIGLIVSAGVAVEVVFVLGFGRLVDWLGLRALMLIGVSAMVVRLALLAAAPSVAVAIGTQLLHGVWVLVVHIVPPLYLNRHAGDAYRNSMQGLFAMVVYGSGRILGNFVAGQVAQVNIRALFGGAACVCAVALAVLAVSFSNDEGVGDPTITGRHC